MGRDLGAVHHPSWRAGVATALGYGLILALLFLVLYLVPYAVFTL